MLATAIVAFGLSLIWSSIVIFANAMSDASSAPYSGAWTLFACWGVTAALLAAAYLRHAGLM